MLIGSTYSLTPFDSNTWSASPPAFLDHQAVLEARAAAALARTRADRCLLVLLGEQLGDFDAAVVETLIIWTRVPPDDLRLYAGPGQMRARKLRWHVSRLTIRLPVMIRPVAPPWSATGPTVPIRASKRGEHVRRGLLDVLVQAVAVRVHRHDRRESLRPAGATSLPACRTPSATRRRRASIARA